MSDGNETLKAIEGYLASKADGGDELAAGLRKMLLREMKVKPLVLEIGDSGPELHEFRSDAERLAFLSKQNEQTDFYCIDIEGGAISEVYTADTGVDTMIDRRTIRDIA